MSEEDDYVPPRVWKWESESGGKFAKINRPVAGPTHDQELPVGEHPHQLYSLATPNGVKATVMFEELLRRLPDIDQAGPAERLKSTFIGGIKHLPVRFTPERVAV